jgi:hypothetical protein
VLATVALLCGACSGDDDGATPDGGDGEATCTVASGGAPGEMRVGHVDGSDFVDLVDGQEQALAWGFQGYLMLIVDIGADVEAAEDEVCFECVATVTSPTSAFNEVVTELPGLPFEPMSAGLYSRQITLILAEEWVNYDGEDAALSVSCDGNVLSGEAERTFSFSVPPRQ